jgi:hypothetical protein
MSQLIGCSVRNFGSDIPSLSHGCNRFVSFISLNRNVCKLWVAVSAMFIFEYKLVLLGDKQGLLPPWLFPTLTPHNIVTIMHKSFPVFMSGCR